MAKRKRNLKVYGKRRKKSKLLFAFRIGASLFIVFIFLFLLVFIYYAKDLPRPEKFLERKFFESTRIYDRTGEILLYNIHGEEKREIIPLDQIPKHLRQAVMAAEDSNFYYHRGIDPKGILRSVLVNLRIRKPIYGGSTLTQQLIRSSFLTLDKTVERKVREIILTIELERRYSKDQILEWYLNQIPFGSNSYGVQAASQTYFEKPAKELNLAESAVLAAMIQGPSRLSPYGPNKDDLMARKNYVLDQMEKNGYIRKEEKADAQKETIRFAEVLEPIKAPHFVLHVKNYLVNKYGEDFLIQKGLRVYTSLDWELQEKAERIVKEGVEVNKNYNAFNASLVAIDPNTGEILSLVGSADWFGDPYPENCISGKNCLFDPKFNIAIGTKNNPGRQPGSAFKPFAYAAALEKGYTSNTILWDAKTEFNPSCSADSSEEQDKYGLDCYHPNNYNGRFKGPMTIRDSLAQSINITSVKTLYLAGVKNTISLAEKMGITTLENDPSRYGLALVLGGGEVKLIDMVSAYGVFATEGETIPPVSVLRIEDSDGNIIEENRKTPKRVLDVETCRTINDILSDNDARAPLFGFNSSLYFKDWQVAAKTGTTQEYKDAWAIGYTPSLVVGVWAGNNDNSPANEKPGVVLAAPIFHKVMEEALLKYSSNKFNPPALPETEKPVLNGEIKTPFHSILHYVNKDDPRGPVPVSPNQDLQYSSWEEAVKIWAENN